tara:strand:+ start:1856 stop:2836 length:981 start_codon:yes stop_codon:yes gene_type:complete
MAAPAASAHLNPVLSHVAFEYWQSQDFEGFIGDKVLPIIPVDEQDGKFYKITTEALAELPDTKRSTGGTYNESSHRFEQDSYEAAEEGIEERVPDDEAARYASYFDMEELAVLRTTGIVRRRHEFDTAAAIQNESTFTKTDAATAWDDVANCDPLTDVDGRRDVISQNKGMEPNTLIITRKIKQWLNRSAEIIERIKYTYGGMTGPLTAQLLADYFMVDQVLVANGYYNSANKGAAASMATIWSDNYAWLGIVGEDPTDDMVSVAQQVLRPGVGNTYMWRNQAPTPVVAESYRDDARRADIARARAFYDLKITDASAGELIKVDNI